MGRDRIIDPVTGDYVSNGKGSWATTTSAMTKCYHVLKTARNTWVGRPARGADFRELERKDTDAELARFETMVAKALQPLVDDGVIANLKTERGRDQAGRPVVNWIATDVQSGAPLAGAEVLPWGA
jgi:hypothetical protein